MVKKIIILGISFFCFFSLSIKAGETKEIINYQYRKNEMFDFSELTIKGNVLAPEDLTLKLQGRVELHQSLPLREDFNDEIKKDFQEMR